LCHARHGKFIRSCSFPELDSSVSV
jgi:hypothetical protein